MLDESICHVRGVWCLVYFVAFILFSMEHAVRKQCGPDQMLHYVVSDLGLHCELLSYRSS